MITPVEGGMNQIVFRQTHGHTGRHLSITPRNSSMKHLAYGRIILNTAKPNESFSCGDRETGLIVLSGNATVTMEDQEVSLGQYDAIYIPRDSSVEIATRSNVDIAEFSAEVSQHYPFQVVRFSQVENDPGLKFTAGGSGSSRANPHAAGQKRGGGTAGGRVYHFGAGQLDQLASPRAR